MTPNRRARRVVGIAATLAAIPFLFPSAASATATLGQSNTPTAPPAPGACAGHLWTAADSETTPQLSKSHPRFVIEGLVKPAGTVTVTEAVTYDARIKHENPDDERPKIDVPDESTTTIESGPQTDGPTVDFLQIGPPKKEMPDVSTEKYEKMRVEYWKGDTMLAATSNYTPDLLDDDTYAWAVTPLGSVDIFEQADRVELVHASQWMKTDDAENAFYPTSVCFLWTPLHTAASVTPTITCDQAVLKLANAGNAKLHLNVLWNANSNDYTIESYGGSYDKIIPLVEDQTMNIVVTDLDTKAVLWSKQWLTDCVAPATTAAPKDEVAPVTTTTAIETQVLGVQVDTSAKPALAFTGSHAGTNATIGAAFLALGLGLVTLGRRRKTVES